MSGQPHRALPTWIERRFGLADSGAVVWLMRSLAGVQWAMIATSK